MATDQDSEQFKLQTLEEIYERQHFFIDRHETIAEKQLTALTILAGFVSVFLTFSKAPSSAMSWFVIIFSTTMFFGFFIFTMYTIISAIRPLSSKAKKALDNKLLPASNKPWIEQSPIYYRGIVKLLNEWEKAKKDPITEYGNLINRKSIKDDYIKQIFILSYYSDYKRKKLELASTCTIITSALGIATLIIRLVLPA